jgi:hypothetical protein
MDLVYAHPNIPAVYTIVVPDDASDEDVRQALLAIAHDAHARPHGRSDDGRGDDWLQERIDQYSNHPHKKVP